MSTGWIKLSEGSEWTLKVHDNPERFVHVFLLAAVSIVFRAKSNTLKSPDISYNNRKRLVTGEDLNNVRSIMGLSPVKNASDTEAILEMIEILRDWKQNPVTVKFVPPPFPREGKYTYSSLCNSVILSVTLCKFLVFSYTEGHRGFTEEHREKPLFILNKEFNIIG